MGALKTIILMCIITCLCGPIRAQGSDASIDKQLEELQQRFKARHPDILVIKSRKLAGETYLGYLGCLKDEYRAERVDPDDENSPTIGAVTDAENTDRRKLYELMAKKNDTTPNEVALQDVIRRFKAAEPEHYFKLRDGTWLTKEEIERRQRERQETE